MYSEIGYGFIPILLLLLLLLMMLMMLVVVASVRILGEYQRGVVFQLGRFSLLESQRAGLIIRDATPGLAT